MNLPDIDVLRKLVELVESHQLKELTVQSGNGAVTVRCEPARPSAVAALPGPVAPLAGRQGAEAMAPAPPAEARRNLVHITSPIVGVFYRSPDPTTDPYVSVGSLVEEGTVVGLVEAMKVFNEIFAEVRGRVVEIPAPNEQLVSRGETLVLIDPLG